MSWNANMEAGRASTTHQPRVTHSRRWLLLVAFAILSSTPALGRADRYEAQLSVRPLVGMAQLREEGVASDERTPVGGLSLGLSYGLSNRLDVGAELVTLTTGAQTFPDTAVMIGGGNRTEGSLTRRAGTALLLIGPTWRFGVGWVPVISLGVGPGVRYRSAGTFLELNVTPPEKAQTVALDLGATARFGLERRMTRRVTLGGYISALAAWSPSAPLLPVATVSVGISYVNYPLW